MKRKRRLAPDTDILAFLKSLDAAKRRQAMELLGEDDDGAARLPRGGAHPGRAPRVAVPLGVGALDVQDRHVGREGGHQDERHAGEGAPLGPERPVAREHV